MKKNKLVSLVMAGVAFGFVACNNSSDTAATDADSANNTTANAGDTSSMPNTAANTSTNDYSAFADSVERNSQAGYYLNARTGKKQRLKVDRSTGVVTDEQSGEPVWHYVDN